MKDFLGNEVEVGDTVAFIPVRRQILKQGVVVKITPCGFTIQPSDSKRKVNRSRMECVLYKKKEVTNE